MKLRPEPSPEPKNYLPHNFMSCVLITASLTLLGYSLNVLSKAHVTATNSDGTEIAMIGTQQLHAVSLISVILSVLMILFSVFVVPRVDVKLSTAILLTLVFGFSVPGSIIINVGVQIAQGNEIASIMKEGICEGGTVSNDAGMYTCTNADGVETVYELNPVTHIDDVKVQNFYEFTSVES